MKKMKVLHIITRLDPGGSATNTLETVCRLDRERFEVQLLSGKTNDPSGRVAAYIQQHGLECYFLGSLVRKVHPFKDLMAFIQLFLFVRRGKFDLVHTHSSKAGIMGRWAAKLNGVRWVVHTPHGHIFYGYFSRLITGIFIMAERVTALVTDRLIELTQKGVNEHLTLGIGTAQQWTVVPSGIDLEAFRPSHEDGLKLRREWGVGDRGLVVMCVGRLEAVKGQMNLVHAWGALSKEFPDARLVLVGDGTDRPLLEARARELGVEGSVIITGQREDVAVCLNGADIYVQPSLNEGMGRAVVEAMACGKPVVLSRVGGMTDLITDGKEGFFVPPADSAALAVTIGSLLRDPARRAIMAVQAVNRATQDFSVQTMVRKLELIYTGLMVADDVKRKG